MINSKAKKKRLQKVTADVAEVFSCLNPTFLNFMLVKLSSYLYD
jgi:hypothetical protein